MQRRDETKAVRCRVQNGLSTVWRRLYCAVWASMVCCWWRLAPSWFPLRYLLLLLLLLGTCTTTIPATSADFSYGTQLVWKFQPRQPCDHKEGRCYQKRPLGCCCHLYDGLLCAALQTAAPVALKGRKGPVQLSRYFASSRQSTSDLICTLQWRIAAGVSDGAMSEAGDGSPVKEAGSSPVKRALQSFSSAVGSVVQQQCSNSNSEKRGEKKQCRVQGGERKSSRGKCTCKARCNCSQQVAEGKVEPQLVLLQILG